MIFNLHSGWISPAFQSVFSYRVVSNLSCDWLLTSFFRFLLTVIQAISPFSFQNYLKSGAWRLLCSFLFAVWHLTDCAACFLTVQLPVLFRGQSDFSLYRAWQLNQHDSFSTPVSRLAWSASGYGSDTGKSGKSFRSNCLLWYSLAVLSVRLNFPEYQTPWLLIFLCCIVRNYCPEHGNLLVSGSQWEMMKLTNRFLSYSIPDYPAFLSAIGRQRFFKRPIDCESDTRKKYVPAKSLNHVLLFIPPLAYAYGFEDEQ